MCSMTSSASSVRTLRTSGSEFCLLQPAFSRSMNSQEFASSVVILQALHFTLLPWETKQGFRGYS